MKGRNDVMIKFQYFLVTFFSFIFLVNFGATFDEAIQIDRAATWYAQGIEFSREGQQSLSEQYFFRAGRNGHKLAILKLISNLEKDINFYKNTISQDTSDSEGLALMKEETLYHERGPSKENSLLSLENKVFDLKDKTTHERLSLESYQDILEDVLYIRQQYIRLCTV